MVDAGRRGGDPRGIASPRNTVVGPAARARLLRGAGPPALYALLSFLYFGLRPLLDSGPSYVGVGGDPQIFIWSFGWWPHALLHGENPLVSHAIWAPSGLGLAWTTTVSGLALVFTPLTLAVGAAASYDVAAVAMPALAAWTAYLLCRRLTHRRLPALVGGYLFGFSSYLLGQEEGHLHMTAVFLVPVVALLLLRYVDGDLDGRGLVLRLGPALAFQLLLSIELLFTLTLAVACSLVVGYMFVGQRRRRLLAAVAPVAASYGVAAVLTAPFVYYLLSDFQSQALHPSQDFLTDLLNLAVPTKLALVARGWAGSIARHFPGNDAERGGYLGVPTLVLVCLYAWQRRRSAGARFLVVSFLVALIATLGTTLTVDGHRLAPLPWEHVGYLPLFDNVLVPRLTLYLALAAAVMAALWLAAHLQRPAAWALAALAVAAIVPDVGGRHWDTSYTLPAFFADGTARTCLAGENVLPLPVGADGNANLWQVEGRFRFTIAGGYLASSPPAQFATPPSTEHIALGAPVPPADADWLRTYIRDKHVDVVVVDARRAGSWAAALDRIARPQRLGGVLVYRVRQGAAPSCKA